jgi:hypothetical protein
MPGEGKPKRRSEKCEVFSEKRVLRWLLLAHDLLILWPMRVIDAFLGAGLFLAIVAANANETFPLLKSGRDAYTNVTITEVTATDIYFSHSGGIGNLKLKNLDAGSQKHFHFDPARASAAEQSQSEATAQFRQNIEDEKLKEKARLQAAADAARELAAHKIYAQSFLGGRPPPISVDHWFTAPPETHGKFVMIFFWISSASQCRDAIPHVNDLAAKFKDQLTVIGLSNEPDEEMRKMTSPQIGFYAGIDTQSRSFTAYKITAVPHAVLVDSSGIVRFEGQPRFLGEKDLARLIDTYQK